MLNNLEINSISVVILDDQITSRLILSKILRDLDPGIKVLEFSDPADALQWSQDNVADLIIVDYFMPGMNGIDFVRALNKRLDYSSVPILMVTVKKDLSTRHDALDAGVTDFLTKPIDLHECKARCKNLITLRQQQLFLEDRATLLEAMVQKTTNNILLREKETLFRLARAGEFKDVDTSNHLVRMSLYSRILANAIGMSKGDAEILELSAPLHDLGKIGIPDRILLKKGALDESELKIMHTHPVIGYEILKDSPSIYLQMGARIALAHHEKYDGSGYPYGIAGEEIPLEAKIVSIADVFDALTTERPYKKAWTIEDSLAYLIQQKSGHFDPQLVDALIDHKILFEEIYSQYALN